jgi:hypothetical protein
LYQPWVFQGSLKKKNYFEGWYFKQVTSDSRHTFAFIPGISLVENDPHAFIQIMDGATGITDYIRYPVDQFRWRTSDLFVKVGSSVFTRDAMMLDIDTENTTIRGRVDFSNAIRYPRSILSPGIMGWYSFVPFMECNHGVISVNHDLKGGVSLNNRVINFDGGKGYIEKDWGTSFPEAWIWVQSNNFTKHGTSFMLSIAKIPWMGKYFVGLISFLYLENRFYLFSTYNKSVFSEVSNNADMLQLTLQNKTRRLKIRVNKNSFCDLQAPVSGEMSRGIKESIDSEVHLQLFNESGKLLYEDSGRNVGLEIMDGIFRYI